MNIKNHFLFDDRGRQIRYLATPNRGGALVPQYLVMHYDGSSNATGAITWMLDRSAKVSAHLHIDRDGNITQLAPFNVVCWHAGKSQWKGLSGLNNYSIGIELQNTGKQEYTTVQLQVAQEVTKALVRHYELEDVLGHSDIAPGRKIDPGPQFPMAQFKAATLNTGAASTKIAITDLNLRSGAGTGHKVVSVLPKSTEVNVLETAGDWSKVFICKSKLQGWVNNKYLV